jgi:hypothetical protein
VTIVFDFYINSGWNVWCSVLIKPKVFSAAGTVEVSWSLADLKRASTPKKYLTYKSASPLIATVLNDAVTDKGNLACTWWNTSPSYSGTKIAYPS